MAIKIGANLAYNGKLPNFERDSFETKAAMKAFDENSIDEGHLSYCKEDGNTYQFKSSNTADDTTGRWRLFKTEADDEDLCSTGDIPVLKFKNRISNPSNHETFGYEILRKNIVGTDNILTKNMLSKKNTTYEIRYDFIITEDITIPANCTLKFNGGSIGGGHTLIGDSTRIEALPVQIFFNDIELSGSFDGVYIYAEWFGAKSLYSKTTANSEYVEFKEVSIPKAVYDLPDAAPAINKALQMSYRGGGEVEMLSRIYHIKTTVDICFRSVLHTQNDTLFVVNMTGDATTKVVHSETSGLMVDTTSEDDAYYTLARNEFFATNSMAIAFKMHPVKTKFYGGGSITLYPSRHTIGIYIYSIGYWYMDMTYYTPIIDMVICGEKKNISSPDPRDLVGSGAPTTEIGSGNSETIYYWDKSNKAYYARQKNKDWKLANSEADPHWNTCMRIEVTTGSSGGRIVNPHINCRMIYGARGLEVVIRDNSGTAWFNESWIEGSLTEMYSNYISVFCQKGLSCDAHDWQKLVVQSSDKSMYDSCMFYAICSGGIKLGHFWDVLWLGSKQKNNYYMGLYSTGINMTWVDGSVEDLGKNNKWGQKVFDYNNKSSILYSMWRNIWDKFVPKVVIGGGILNSAIEIDNISDKELKDMVSGQAPSKYIFDSDLATSCRIIDPENNKHGFYLKCYNKFNSSSYYNAIEKQTRYGYVLAIKYKCMGSGPVKCRVYGERPTTVQFKLRDINLNKGKLVNQINSEYLTETEFIEIPYNNVRDLTILIYTTDETEVNMKFDLVALELYVANLGGVYAEELSNKNEPTAPPHGCIYLKNGSPRINRGDAENPNWTYVGERYVDFADAEVSRIFAEKYGDGNNVTAWDLSKLTSLGSLFTNNNLIKTFNELPILTNLKVLNKDAFKNCSALTSIDLSNIEEIGIGAFNGCSNLQELGSLDSIKKISSGTYNSTFKGVKLDSISLPSLERLVGNVFNASSITRFENLGKIQVIQNGGNYTGAFSNNSALRFIRIPATCVEIQENSFRFSSKNATFVMEGATPPSLSPGWEYGDNGPKEIYVPDASVEAYKSADVWSKYADRIKPVSDFPA